jgi:2'-5' RNA ligase
VGRIRGDDLVPELQSTLARHEQWTAGTMMVDEVHVLSSELASDGPVYTVLSREKLLAAG